MLQVIIQLMEHQEVQVVVELEELIPMVEELVMQEDLVHQKEILEVLDKNQVQPILVVGVVELEVLEEMDLHQVQEVVVDLDHLLLQYLEVPLNLIMDQQE